jgi:hypothetical protein
LKEIETMTMGLISLVSTWEPKLAALDEKVLSQRKNSQNRTIKQILGHLIDSISNNTHRTVHLQYQKSPFEFPNYATFGNNDRWIAIQNYQDEDWNTMIQLWKYSSFHFCHVAKNVDLSKLGNEWVAGPGRNITLKELLVDFLRHFKLHLSEMDDLIEGRVTSPSQTGGGGQRGRGL